MIKRAIPRMPTANTNSIVGAYVPAWHIALGIIIAVVISVGLPLSLLYWLPASAKTSLTYNADYASQARSAIAAIEAAYDTTRLYYDGRRKQADVKTAHGALGELADRLGEEPAPLSATAVREQIIFAANRCQNYAAKIGWVLPANLENVFVVAVEAQGREYCAVQIHAAKMRLIDYGVANGVNPFAE